MNNASIVFLLLIPFFVQGQIVITADDLPKAGDVFSSVDCELSDDLNIGLSGANQIYDFSMLTPIDTFNNSFVSPNETAGHSEFLDATLAGAFEDGFVYYKQTNSDFSILGAYIDTSDNASGQYLATHFIPNSKIIEIPSTYNSSFTDMSGYSNTLAEGSDFADSIRSTVVITDNILFDGYGSVITPSGTFDALRERKISTATNVVELYSMGAWIVFNSSTVIDTSYNWYGKNNFSLVSADVLDGEVVNVSYAISDEQVLMPVANFMANNLGEGTFSFNDNSINAPTSWLWDFGDGNMSTEQNPQHTFVTSETYNICLSATNSSGSDTHCESIEVIVTGTEDLVNSGLVDVYPNPVTHRLNIFLKERYHETLDFHLFNTNGKAVFESQVVNVGANVIDFSNINKGLYIYILKDSRGVIIQKGSLVKEGI